MDITELGNDKIKAKVEEHINDEPHTIKYSNSDENINKPNNIKNTILDIGKTELNNIN